MTAASAASNRRRNCRPARGGREGGTWRLDGCKLAVLHAEVADPDWMRLGPSELLEPERIAALAVSGFEPGHHEELSASPA